MLNTSVSVMALAIAAQSVGLGLAGAQGFAEIGPSTRAWAVSADGTVVVGSGSGNEAFRWVEGVGTSGLGFLPGGIASHAYGVNADGTVVVGYGYDGTSEAFRWVAGEGMSGLGLLVGYISTCPRRQRRRHRDRRC